MHLSSEQRKKLSRQFEALLPLVEKPGRYIGGEINSVIKDPDKCRLRVVLAFPDTYEIGMSHLGIQILYAILNNEPDVAAERAFAPWPDMESRMRAQGVPLMSYESRTPLAAFDVVGFSLQYELSYTNVLNMLDMSGIPLRSLDRGEEAPIIIAGGPCAFNPEPIAPFMDAVVVGEGEEVILEIARKIIEGKEKKWNRQKKLEALASIDGVYVPCIHTHGEQIKRRTVADLNLWQCPEKPVLPLIQAVHDRINLEIARGCTRGCRFCQAGMIWRPVRERTPHVLHRMAGEMLASTGCEEISLLSLSSGDYSLMDAFLPELMDRYYRKRVAIALPSLRVESLTPRLIDSIKRVRKTSFTLAPEAGTERLRKIINKGNTEADLLATANRIFTAGWNSIKLYFMLGLPGETQEDLEGIVDLSYKVLRVGGKKKQVNVSLSSFVPKPHTPFQWHRQISADEIREKQEFFKNRLKNRNLVLKWHDRRMSFLEGIFSRGDRAVASVLEAAFRNGCRFDGWSDHLRFDVWEQALRECQVNVDSYLGPRSHTEALPWDHVHCGVGKDFLLSEWQKALAGDETRDCRRDCCHNCGACKDGIAIISAADREPRTEAQLIREESPSSVSEKHYRMRFVKKDRMRFLSHLETAAALVRGIRQAGMNFVHTSGFHPHPKISFAYASSVGIESRSEYADIQILPTGKSPNSMIRAINANLPQGLEVAELTEISSGHKSLSKEIYGFQYEIALQACTNQYPVAGLERKLENFRSQAEFMFQRKLKGKEISRDLKPLVDHISIDNVSQKIRLTLRTTSNGGVKPIEIMIYLFGIDLETAKILEIIKTETLFVTPT